MSGLEDNIEEQNIDIFDTFDSGEKFIDYDEQLHSLIFDISVDFKEYITDNCLPLFENIDYCLFIEYIEEHINKN
jgi:hypothetical protein